MPEMMTLIGWLQSHIPAEDADPTVTRISHGDFRCAAIAHTVSLLIARHVCLQSLLLSLCTWNVAFLWAIASASGCRHIHVQDVHARQLSPFLASVAHCGWL